MRNGMLPTQTFRIEGLIEIHAAEQSIDACQGCVLSRLIALRETRSRSQLKVRRIAEEKIEAIDRRISELMAIRDDLVGLVEKCKATGTKADCVILGAIDDVTAADWCRSTV